MGNAEPGKGADGNAGRDTGSVKAPTIKNVVNLENYTIEANVGGKWYRWEPRGFKNDTVKMTADDVARLSRLPVGKHLKIGG